MENQNIEAGSTSKAPICELPVLTAKELFATPPRHAAAEKVHKVPRALAGLLGGTLLLIALTATAIVAVNIPRDDSASASGVAKDASATTSTTSIATTSIATTSIATTPTSQSITTNAPTTVKSAASGSTTTAAVTKPTTVAVAAAPVPALQPAWAPVAWTGKTLRSGSRGEAVASAKVRLDQLHYDVGDLNAAYDTSMYHAVMAFQKTNDLNRTGVLDPDTMVAMQTAQDPLPLTPEVGATRVEVHIDTQTFRYWVDAKLVRIMSVSTGTGRHYCDSGVCGTATTPRGIHMTYRRIKGVRVADLGTLYDPVYFKGGFAMHGSPSVPAGPASHGCVRVPMVSSLWVYDNIGDGVPVVVFDGNAIKPEWIVPPAPAPQPTFA